MAGKNNKKPTRLSDSATYKIGGRNYKSQDVSRLQPQTKEVKTVSGMENAPRQVRKQVENLPHYREKTDRLLFRLVNHLQPRNMLEVGTGSGLSARYMSEAKHVPLYTFDEGKYEFYVEPGEYEIKVSLDSGMVTAADVTITNASVERNLELGE